MIESLERKQSLASCQQNKKQKPNKENKPMKLNVNAEEYELLDDAIKSEYKQGANGYELTVDGLEDTGALKRAKEHEKERRQKVESELKEIKDQLTLKEDEIIDLRKGAVSKDDVDALERSYKEKLEKSEKEYTGRINDAEGSLRSMLVDNVASKIANEISTVPDLMSGAISARLTTEIVDGKATTRVLDRDGKPSALTVDELKKEFVANEKFSSIIVGSNASGSGAIGSGNGSGASKKFSDMSEADRVSLYKDSPDDYRKLRDQEQTLAQ